MIKLINFIIHYIKLSLRDNAALISTQITHFFMLKYILVMSWQRGLNDKYDQLLQKL